jgi:dipeptidyl aminopeptidase/acylaminoacyl peptidase
MNDVALERELRAWYESELDETVVAPAELRTEVMAIPRREVPIRRIALGRRPMTLLVAAVVGTAAIVGSALVGSSLLRQDRARPSPSLAALVPPDPPGPTASARPAPPASATPTPNPILGGGRILASVPHAGERPCHTTAAPFDIVTIDPATAATTVLGTTGSTCDNRTFDVHWANDRSGIILLDRYGPEQLDLPIVTDAGRQFPLICCNLPANVWEGGGSGGQNWLMSPRGDRVAAVHTAPSDRGDGIVVSDVQGVTPRTLPLPRGADAYGFSWSPDESVIAVTACLPCGTAQERGRLFLVPVDGSAVRTLVNPAPGAGIGFAAWAPDGRTIASVASTCGAGDAPRDCPIEHQSWSLVTIDVATGSVRTIATGPDLGHADAMLDDPAWSPDGRRIVVAVSGLSDDAVEPVLLDPDGGNVTRLGAGRPRQWSPDGQWILVTRGRVGTDVWIVPASGGGARHLGEYLSTDW